MGNIQEQPAQPQIEKIRAVNSHLRTAVDRVSDGVLILESEPLEAPGPRIVYINHAGRRITGYREAGDILGQPIGMIYDPLKLKDFLVRLPAVAKSGKTYQMQTATTCADGSIQVLRWTVTALRDDAGQPVNYLITILPDVDTRFANVASAGQQMEAAGTESDIDIDCDQIHSSKMESLALVASGIAHDFNNILTTVIANLSLAKLETAIDTELRSHIQDATTACDGAKSLIQQLLAFARGDTPVKRETHIGNLLNEAVRLATYGANVRCEVTVAEDLWSAEVDRTQITQVMSNLLINARQAMPKGGVIQASAENKSVTIQEGLNLVPGNYVMITVRDRGYGIPESHMKKIFDPFFTTKKTGSGLGLATSYALVQKHLGTLLVRSKEGVGTEFKIYLPATGRMCAPQALKSEEILVSGEGCVLVVDDQESVRTVAAAILGKLGYEALTSSSGREAVEIYCERMRSGQPVAAILMDMTLPGGLSGEDTFDEIRKIDPDVCSIATSGYFDEDSHERFIDRGFAGLLPKPYTAETLSQNLHEAMHAERKGR